MKKFIKITFCLCAIVLLIGCGKKDNKLKENEGVKTVTLALDSNPTTGYNWVYEIENDDIINVINEEYIKKPVDEGVVGSGGKSIYEIEAIKAGTTKIVFKYKRSWEEEVVEEKTYNIKVNDNLLITVDEE